MIVLCAGNSLFNLGAEIRIYFGQNRQWNCAGDVVRGQLVTFAVAAIAIDDLNLFRSLPDPLHFGTQQNWTLYRFVKGGWNAIHSTYRLEHGGLHVDHLVEHHIAKLVIPE